MSDTEDVDEPEPEQDGSQKSDNENDLEKEEPNILTEETAGKSLSLLCKSGDGLSHAFIRADLKEKNLSDISILEGYIHLRFVDISKNRLTDLGPLNNLTHLLSLKADNNNLEKIGLRSFPFLQQASFSFNKINDTSGLEHPLLEQLNLSNNRIESVKYLRCDLLSKLHTLEIRSNKIQSIEELNIPSLKNLYIDYNSISNLDGISRMNQLENLSVKKNKVTELTCFSEPMSELKYLDIRENLIVNIEEIGKLKGLICLESLLIAENPVCQEEGFRMEVLMHLQSISKLNEDDVAEDEKLEALEIAKQRQLEKEKLAEYEEMENISRADLPSN